MLEVAKGLLELGHECSGDGGVDVETRVGYTHLSRVEGDTEGTGSYSLVDVGVVENDRGRLGRE